MQLKSAFFVITACIALSISSVYAEEQDLIGWLQIYYRLGIHPTENEIRSKMNKLGFEQDQIAAMIKTDQGPEADAIISAGNEQRGQFYKTAKELLVTSKSKMTKEMSTKALALIDEIHLQQKTRDVGKYLISENKLKSLGDILANRADAEIDMEAVREQIKSMSSAPRKGERDKILNKIAVFYQKESEDSKFDVTSYKENVIAEFNDHINRLNEYMQNSR